jgi:hypothetical protein
MPRVVRLVTLVDVAEGGDVGGTSASMPREVRSWTEARPGAGEDVDRPRISVSARHEAVLDDGGRLLLLDDRGWTEELRGAGADEFDDLWALTPERDIVETARMVVGPDEPLRGRSQDEIETDHWNALTEILHAHGAVVDADELRRLPHDVVLSERLRARLPHTPGGAA